MLFHVKGIDIRFRCIKKKMDILFMFPQMMLGTWTS